MAEQLTYDDICQIVGRQFLSSEHRTNVLTESANKAVGELKARAEKAEKERDAALSLLTDRQPKSD